MKIRKLKLSPSDKHNASRRKKYHGDGEYRDRQIARARKAYRKKAKVELYSCLHTLKFLPQLAVTERVYTSGAEIKNMPVFNIPNTAMAMQKIYQTVWRWIQKEQLPNPILKLVDKEEYVYHQDEVCIFVEEIGNHELSMKYYRRDHDDVRERVFSRIEAKRKELNL